MHHTSTSLLSLFQYMDAPEVLAWLGDTVRTRKKSTKYIFWIIDAPNSVRIACMMAQEVIVPSIYWRGNALYVNRKTHRNSCAWLGDSDRHSVRLPYLLKNRCVFGPYRSEKKIFYFNKNVKFKFQIDLDRHGPKPLFKSSCWTPPPPFHCTLPLRFGLILDHASL